jgi:Rho-binding antiterminator
MLGRSGREQRPVSFIASSNRDPLVPGDSLSARRYRPIDCSLHDHLEAVATLGTSVSLVYRAGDEREVQAQDRIVDIVASGGVEFVELETGGRVRLDDLVMVGGIRFVGGGDG